MMARITRYPDRLENLADVDDLAETMEALIDKYLDDIGDLHHWGVRIAARQQLGQRLIGVRKDRRGMRNGA